MNTEKQNQSLMFELYSTSNVKVRGGVFRPGRILLGRSETCDLMVGSEAVSAIHAVMEIFPTKAVIYDMNSTNGTFVNGDRIVAKDIFPGDHFQLAGVDFEYRLYNAATSLPPVLDALEPMQGKASVKTPPRAPSAPSLPTIDEVVLPSIVYPLAADPKAEFSEYIFEDQKDIYPIFKYQTSKQAVEVIILFKENIFSIDYLPAGNFSYQISGVKKSLKDIEFPYLGKGDKYPFITLHKNQLPTVNALPGFKSFLLSDAKTKNADAEQFELAPQDILRLYNGDLQIFVRSVESPPSVASAPILKRDPDFQKYLFFFLFLVVLAGVGFNLIELPEPEVKEELAAERLATILYKQPLTLTKNKAAEKTEKTPPRAQKAPDKPAVEKKVVTQKQPDVKKPDVVQTKTADKKPDPGKKTAQTKQVVKQGTTPPKTTAKKAAPKAAPKASQTAAAAAKNPPAVSQVQSKSVGHVEVYKSADFKSTVSSLVAKGGSLSAVQTKSASGSSGTQIGAATGVSSGSGSIETADISTNQGSLVGATVGKLGESIGAEGLSAKRAIYQAGIPAETVVLGSMDPDVIRRILLDNLIHFRSCYQNELSTRGQEFSGNVKLNFTIGASGHVTQAGVDGSSSLPTGVKKCVVNVLRGIAFPAPQGGGVVEVKQPMNFYPKKI